MWGPVTDKASNNSGLFNKIEFNFLFIWSVSEGFQIRTHFHSVIQGPRRSPSHFNTILLWASIFSKQMGKWGRARKSYTLSHSEPRANVCSYFAYSDSVTRQSLRNRERYYCNREIHLSFVLSAVTILLFYSPNINFIITFFHM